MVVMLERYAGSVGAELQKSSGRSSEKLWMHLLYLFESTFQLPSDLRILQQDASSARTVHKAGLRVFRHKNTRS